MSFNLFFKDDDNDFAKSQLEPFIAFLQNPPADLSKSNPRHGR